MAFNVNEFLAALKFGGARSTLFQVTISNPVNSIGDIQVPLMTRAASLPGRTIGVVNVPYFGRQAKVAGNVTYEEWQTTMFNDEDYAIRNAIEQWNHAINPPQTNLTRFSSASPSLYQSTAQVAQFSKTGVPLRVYNFVGIWPAVISPIELNWEGEGIQEFQVTWAYQYWYVSGGITGTAGGF